MDERQRRIAELTNLFRLKKGLPRLELDDQLMASARSWARELAESGDFRHSEHPAENICRAQSIYHALTWLANSPRHHANIVGRFTRIGTGCWLNGHGIVHVVQQFS